MGLLQYNMHVCVCACVWARAHTHTRLHKSQENAESQQWMDWPLSDYLAHWPPNNSNHLHAHSTLYVCRWVTRRQSSLNALFHTSQAYRCSSICMHWFPAWVILTKNALLHTSQLYGRSPQCMYECFIRVPLSLNALLHKSKNMMAITTMYVCMLYQSTLVSKTLLHTLQN